MSSSCATQSHNTLACAAVILTTAALNITGCQKPETWSFTGPRVYLIEGAPDEGSDGLAFIRHELDKHEINAKSYTPENWLRIVIDIDAAPDEEAILVGHGHGAFLATQVVRHYAQHHKMKFIDAVFTIDPFNRDWPHNPYERGEHDPHTPPMPVPVGHNAIKVHNVVQQDPDSWRWGADLASTRASNAAFVPPYYWYDDFWDRAATCNGQRLAELTPDEGVTHETIDNQEQLLQRIVLMCRKAALSPYHYTPPKHHPDVKKKDQTQPVPRESIETTWRGDTSD